MTCDADVTRRLKALEEFDIMDSAPTQELDDIAALASQICKTPMATVTLLDDRRQWFKAKVGLDIDGTGIEDAFCAHAIKRPHELMVVPDAARDVRFKGNRFVVNAPGVRFYVGAPLVTEAGVAIGTVCAIDTVPRRLQVVQRDALRALARQAMALIEREKTKKSLKKMREFNESLVTSETYFRHLTEFALDLITILEPDGTIRFESRSIERELGYTPEHYRGKNAFEFVHPDDLPMVMGAFVQAVQRDGDTPTIRFRFQHRDGSYRVLEGNGNNLINDPAVRGIVFNSRDVTEKIELQSEVERSRVEKEETIGLLTGGVAHDFNNILTSIQGHAELTSAKVPRGSAESKYLADIQAATARAAALTRQLLALSHRVVLQPKIVAFDPWLLGMESKIRASAGNAVEVIVKANTGRHVWVDGDQWEQVVLHLVSNARDAMPGGGSITVEGVTAGPGTNDDEGQIEGRGVRLSVTDNGTGMVKGVLARIFDPYFTTKSATNHSGLGLAMCRGIVEQSGGSLCVTSEAGMGTTFALYLNAVEALEEETAAVVTRTAGSSSAPKILFVDDEPFLRDIAEIMLTEEGYDVALAEDGQAALGRYAEIGGDGINILVTDVLMPGMNGIQLAEEVCRLNPNVRVLLCSGYTRDAIAPNGGIPAGYAFLQKPYKQADLLKRIQEMLAE